MLKMTPFSPARPQRAETRFVPHNAAASEEARRTLRYVEPLSDARTPLEDFFSILLGRVLVFACVRLQPIQPIGQGRLQDK